jgi:hypothetical protein
VAYKKVKYVFDPIGDLKIVNKQAVLEEISELLKEEILDHVGSGKSPVSKENFPKLKKTYADDQKFGDDTPNLELSGDMLDSLTVRPNKGKIEVFVEGGSKLMRGKVEGHNQHDSSLTPKIRKRRFIPTEDQTFKRGIMRAIKDILEENTEAETLEQSESAMFSKSVEEALKDFGFSKFINTKKNKK